MPARLVLMDVIISITSLTFLRADLLLVLVPISDSMLRYCHVY